jgi:hypothetical protein
VRKESAAKSIAILVNPANSVFAQADAKEAQQAACALGVNLLILNANNGHIPALTTILGSAEPSYSSPAAALKSPAPKIYGARDASRDLLDAGRGGREPRVLRAASLSRGLANMALSYALVEGGVP